MLVAASRSGGGSGGGNASAVAASSYWNFLGNDTTYDYTQVYRPTLVALAPVSASPSASATLVLSGGSSSSNSNGSPPAAVAAVNSDVITQEMTRKRMRKSEDVPSSNMVIQRHQLQQQQQQYQHRQTTPPRSAATAASPVGSNSNTVSTSSSSAAVAMLSGSESFEREISRVREQVELLENKYRGEYRDTMKRESIPHDQLMKIVMKSWFERNYRVPRTPEERKRATQISRGDLRDRLNAFLVKIPLPEIGNKDYLWGEWFLSSCVGLDSKERSTGKAVALEPCISKENIKKALQQMIDQIEEEQRREEEDDLLDDGVDSGGGRSCSSSRTHHT